jgi:hypothetical protein
MTPERPLPADSRGGLAQALRTAAAVYASDAAFQMGLLLAFGLLAMALSLAAHPVIEVLANLG